jgi:hypothetical protein
MMKKKKTEKITDWDGVFKPVREKEAGMIGNWVADRTLGLSSWLMNLAMPYALMYEWEIDDEDEDEDDAKYYATPI